MFHIGRSNFLRAWALAILCLSECHTDQYEDVQPCRDSKDVSILLRRCCESVQLPGGCQCFSISPESGFNNTILAKPMCPGRLAVKFFLHDRQHKDLPVLVMAGPRRMAFRPHISGKKTVLVTHGFTDSGSALWMMQMKDELLEAEDINVILVDWKHGAKHPNYYQAVANTRIVGAMLGRLLQDFNARYGAAFDSFHLVGHSLGAHVMGYAGKEVLRLTGQMVGRITGLDPAGPAFEKFDTHVRLDARDAKFVDIIHTDGEPLLSSGFGIRISIGHVDFYPNGGQHQPGCPTETLGILSMLDFEDERAAGACSHHRAIRLFLDSISRCRQAPSSTGRYRACNLGYYTKKYCKGEFRPNTTSEDPYCVRLRSDSWNGFT